MFVWAACEEDRMAGEEGSCSIILSIARSMTRANFTNEPTQQILRCDVCNMGLHLSFEAGCTWLIYNVNQKA